MEGWGGGGGEAGKGSGAACVVDTAGPDVNKGGECDFHRPDLALSLRGGEGRGARWRAG